MRWPIYTTNRVGWSERNTPYYRTEAFLKALNHRLEAGRQFPANRLDVRTEAEAYHPTLVAAFKRLSPTRILSIGSGPCWDEILLSDALPGVEMIASTHVLGHVSKMAANVPTSIRMTHVDVLDPETLMRVPGPYTLFLPGVMSAFTDRELTIILGQASVDSVVLFLKSGELLNLRRLVSRIPRYLLRTVFPTRFRLMGWSRTEGQIRWLFAKTGYQMVWHQASDGPLGELDVMAYERSKETCQSPST